MTHDPVGRQNGAAIRVIRELRKLSVEETARYVGIHEQSLRNIENGRRPAGTPVIEGLARVLAIPVAAIMRDGSDSAACPRCRHLVRTALPRSA